MILLCNPFSFEFYRFLIIKMGLLNDSSMTVFFCFRYVRISFLLTALLHPDLFQVTIFKHRHSALLEYHYTAIPNEYPTVKIAHSNSVSFWKYRNIGTEATSI